MREVDNLWMSLLIGWINGRALVRLVAADALEDGRAILEGMREDVDFRVLPLDELVVHPDVLCFLHLLARPKLISITIRT